MFFASNDKLLGWGKSRYILAESRYILAESRYILAESRYIGDIVISFHGFQEQSEEHKDYFIQYNPTYRLKNMILNNKNLFNTEIDQIRTHRGMRKHVDLYYN